MLVKKKLYLITENLEDDEDFDVIAQLFTLLFPVDLKFVYNHRKIMTKISM